MSYHQNTPTIRIKEEDKQLLNTLKKEFNTSYSGVITLLLDNYKNSVTNSLEEVREVEVEVEVEVLQEESNLDLLKKFRALSSKEKIVTY